MSDFTIRLPWINRRRPFVSLHIDTFPGYKIRNGRSYKYFHCGLIWGRQFMPTSEPCSAWWFDITVPW